MASSGTGDTPVFHYQTSLHEKSGGRLIDGVAQVCRRLAGGGWDQLFSCHGLDIRADDLAAELARGLEVDRVQPGFGDFSADGRRGIEPGSPGRSLLFHAFASPEVTGFRTGDEWVELSDYPTMADLEAVENYVYGAAPPSVEDLRARADGAPLAIVVFASEYRPAVETVHQLHADMCYSRTGVARIGTRGPDYVGALRGFAPLRAGDGKSIAVLPARYAAYIAALKPGAKDRHGPMHFVEAKSRPTAGSLHMGKDAGVRPPAAPLAQGEASDEDRQFWVPLHKLFDGDECLRGYDLDVGLAASHCNEKLRRAHLFFGSAGHYSGWCEPCISKHPFVITTGIAELSEDPLHGAGLVVPVDRAKLVEAAEFEGKPLTYKVPESKDGVPWELYRSSLNLIAVNDDARKAPEYLHARHVVSDSGEENLNLSPNLIKRLKAGGYRARHYLDYTGDGWISVECAALALEIPRRLSAYSIVASPDYFPDVRQSDLVAWTDQSAPPALLETVWPANPGRPEPLSSQRFAANLELKAAGFDRRDDTMTAIVGSCGSGQGTQMKLTPVTNRRMSMLPDSAAGVFAPGWDVSFDRTAPNPAAGGRDAEGITFLNNYGLGSPFPEDAMLCAALSSFWPAVAPDITRTFAPTGSYHSATPMTDEAIGLGIGEPWDGIKGPVPGPSPDKFDYKRLEYGDYVEAAMAGRFDLSSLADTTPFEYIARTLTMAMVYDSLGVSGRFEKSKWAVLSFKPADPNDPDLIAAKAEHGRALNPDHTYRFEMIRHDNETEDHPTQFDRLLVTAAERVLLFADPTIVLRCKPSGQGSSLYARSSL